MPKSAVVDVVVNKDDAMRSLQDVGQALDDLEKKSKTAWARFYGGLDKDTRKAIDSATDAVKSSLKSTILSQVSAPLSAIANPAKTTWEGALTAANAYRDGVQRVATSTGQGFDQISGRVKSIALSSGELPKTVISWGEGLKGVSKDWATAAESISAYKDRALQLNVPLQALGGVAQNLAGAFGIQSTAQVDKFFGTLDAYAKRSGVTAGRLQQQWATFGEAFGRLSSGDPTKFGAITAAFAASSSNPEQAKRNQAFGMGLLNTSPRQVEQRMRRAGLLKKGEMLTGENGEVSPEMYTRAMRFLQKDLINYYGSKKKAIEIQGETLEGRREVAGFVNTDFSVTKEPAPAALPRTGMKSWQGAAAGGRERGNVIKNQRDIELGATALPAQDFAVRNGGGKRGLAIDAGSNVLGTAWDRFGDIALGALGAGAYSKGGALLARMPMATRALQALGAGNPVVRAGLFGVGMGTALDTVPLNDRQITAGQKGETISDIIARKAFEFLHPDAATTPIKSEAPEQKAPEIEIASSSLRGISDSLMSALSKTVLRVMAVEAGAPEGEPNVGS